MCTQFNDNQTNIPRSPETPEKKQASSNSNHDLTTSINPTMAIDRLPDILHPPTSNKRVPTAVPKT